MEVSGTATFGSLVDLAAESLGGKAIFTNDDFFASKDGLLKPGRGVFIPGKYTEVGKWMDGWESRRKRTEGHDHCIVKLGVPGYIRSFDIDTNHFLGNHPPYASVDAAYSENGKTFKWVEILPQSPLKPGSQNLFVAKRSSETSVFTHVRLNIYPDGGVARFRVYGEVAPVAQKKTRFDLAALENGGKVLACNDMFFGSMDNLIAPGRAPNMGDGWETRRKRQLFTNAKSAHDWCLVKLAVRGVIDEVEIDTNHFKGNYPDRFSLDGIAAKDDAKITDILSDTKSWIPLVAEQKLKPSARHLYKKEIGSHKGITHVRLNIFPDGGVSRMRLWGKKA